MSAQGRPTLVGPPPLPGAGRASPAASPSGAARATIDAGPFVEIAGILLKEAEATQDAVRKADLLIRLGLLCWDVLEDAEAAERYLCDAAASAHPLAARLRAAVLLSRRDTAGLAKLQSEPALAKLAGLQAQLSVSLLMLGDAERAVAAARAATTAREHAPEDAARLEIARDVLRIALGGKGTWKELSELGRKAPPDDLDLRLEHARALLDAQGAADADPEIERNRRRTVAREVLSLLDKAFFAKLREATGGDRLARTLYALDLALEALDVVHGDKRTASVETSEMLLRERLAALSDVSDAETERASAAFQLAVIIEPARGAEALDALLLVGDAPGAMGARLTGQLRRRLQLQQGAWAEAAETLQALVGEGDDPAGVRAAYLRRAAELLEARAGDRARAEQTFLELAEAADRDVAATRALLRIRLGRGGTLAGLGPALEAAARLRVGSPIAQSMLAFASLLGEAEGRPADALKARREMSAPDVDDLVRLCRATGDAEGLAEAYGKAATEAADTRVAAAFQVAAGAVRLAMGDVAGATESLGAATAKAPDDLVARAIEVAIHRKAGRWKELAKALEAQLDRMTTPLARSNLLRELGRVAKDRLGDVAQARKALEQALELDPEDATTLVELARLCEQDKDWKRAVELRERAVESAKGSPRAAAILLELGELFSAHLGDDAAARSAFERALELDEGAVQAITALIGLHKKAKRVPEQLAAMNRLVALEEPAARIKTYEDIAKLAGDSGDVATALAALESLLALEPTQAAALTTLERIARKENQWGPLAAAYGRAVQDPKGATVRNLRTLGDALEKLERWDELGPVRLRMLDAIKEPKELAKAARTTAQLYEERLRRLDEAARLYLRAHEAEPDDPHAIRALQKLLRMSDRHADLAEALDRELPTAKDPKRQLELLVELGELLRGPLARLEDAAKAFEAVLKLDDKHLPALRAVAEVYSRLGRDQDLQRTLDRTSSAVDDDATRAELALRKAEMSEQRGDLDAALAAYRDAFRLDPSNRAVFTAFERLCYKRERWRDAMDLYQSAIEAVERGKSRAYRLGDLYARRGQLQMQYLGAAGEAVASYGKVLEVDAENEGAMKALETLLTNQEDWAGLVKALERRFELLAEKPAKPTPGVDRDALRAESGRKAARVAGTKLRDSAEQARLYARVLEVDPASMEALEALERHYERSREHGKLIDVLKTRLALATGPEEQSPLHQRIANLAEEGLRDVDLALDHYKKLLELRPGSREILDALARIYESVERWAEFIDITRKQIRATTDRQAKALLYFKCGSVMEAKFSRDDDAILYYDAAIKTSSSCLPAVHGLRDLYLRRQDWKKVIDTLEHEVKLWQEAKEQAGVYAHIGQIYGERLQESERAIHFFEQALLVDPECMPANRALFDLFFSRGDFVRAAPVAEALAQKATREGEPSERSEFYRKRGVVAEKMGDPRGAAESFVIALEIRPENLSALDSLASLCRRNPSAYDFQGTFRELEKIYRRGDPRGLARTLVVEGALRLSQFEVDGAEAAFREAISLDPDDPSISEPLVDLLVLLRRFGEATHSLNEVIGRSSASLPEVRAHAFIKLAQVRSEGLGDSEGAAAALRRLLEEQPEHREAYYLLAQEQYVLGRFPEARQAIDKAIELANEPDASSPEELARYFYYLGRILDAQGDGPHAASNYRRAAEYDPAYPPPQLALARRAASQGDTQQAEATLDEAVRAAQARGDDEDGMSPAIPLLRGLAQIQLASGSRNAAVQSLRTLIDLTSGHAPPDSDDCVTLAEAYAQSPESVGLALGELGKVVARDLRHAPTYRLLVSIFERMNERDRVARVLAVLDLLGYAEEVERTYLGNLRTQRAAMMARRIALTEVVRAEALVHEDARSPHVEMLAAIRNELAALYPGSYMGEDPQPIGPGDDPGLKVVAQDSLRMFDLDVEVLLARGVPGGVLALDIPPKPVIVIDRALAGAPEVERRFLLGRAMDPLRGAYSLVLRLSAQQRAELWALVAELFKPEGARAPSAQDFARSLPRKVAQQVRRLSDQAGGAAPPIDAERLTAALALTADRAGLAACDDVAAGARVLVRLGGGELAAIGPGDGRMGEGSAVALGAVPGGADLVRYYLSDGYHRLRVALVESPRA